MSYENQAQVQSSNFWLNVSIALFILQAIIGVIMFEYYWDQTKVYRVPNKKLHDKFPMWQRHDNPQKWSRLQWYPGAILAFTPRFIMVLSFFFIGTGQVQIFKIGHDFSKGPIQGIRRHVMKGILQFCTTAIIFISGMKIERKQVNMDYTEYLGPDYQNMKKPKYVSTIISNHVSWLDGFISISQTGCALAPDAGFAKAPIFGTFLKVMDALFMPRSNNAEEKEKALLTIKTRQEEIEEKGNYSPFLIFPEGSTTNGTALMSFKRGAFNFEKTVQPQVLKYSFGGYSSDYSLMDLMPLVALTQCWIWGGLKCEYIVLPQFTPNEHMFKKFADKGKERWEVYAWVMRDIMAKAGGLGVTEWPIRLKYAYWYHIWGEIKIADFENKSVEQIIEEYNKLQEEKKEKKEKKKEK